VSDHHGVVYGYAFRLTGNQADAEDVSQQTFLTAQRHLHQLRSPDNPVPWLLAIARSCWMKSFRRQRPVAAAAVELNVDEVAEELPADDIDREQLQLALDQLTDEFRLVVVMFYFEELSYKEIAAALEIPIGTVMSRLARAKSQLRKLLTPVDEDLRDKQVDPLDRVQNRTETTKSPDSKISTV
jgi:RNA polymerase sigma-70 factor (ECF subfamily)